MPVIWTKPEGETKTVKLLGLGKFSRSSNLTDASSHREDLIAFKNDNNRKVSNAPMFTRDESSCSAPRRISFKQDEDVQEVPLPLLEPNQKKTVRFSPQPDDTSDNRERVTTRLWEGVLTEEHRRELWYQKAELAAIKLEAKIAIANRAKVENSLEASIEEQDSMIGLERFSKQRAVWKKSAIHYVLMAQRQIRGLGSHIISTEDYIQSVSLRCTAWAREAAKKQGFRDYCAVHDPLASLFSNSDWNNDEISRDEQKEEKQNYNELIFGEPTCVNTTNKRTVDAIYNTTSNRQEQVGCERRVRHRTALLSV